MSFERLEGKVDAILKSHDEMRQDIRELKTELKPVFEHVSMVKGVIKAVGLGATIGGLLVGIMKLFL